MGSAELSVPLAPDQFDGYVFFDIGSDLKSGSQVLGDPADPTTTMGPLVRDHGTNDQ